MPKAKAKSWTRVKIVLRMEHDALRARFYRGINRVGRLQTCRNADDAERFDPTKSGELKECNSAAKWLESRGWRVVRIGVDP